MNTSSKLSVRTAIVRALLASSALLLAACQQSEPSQTAAAPVTEQSQSHSNAMEWARGALERNPQIEVVASDNQAQVFTVRDRQTGAVQAVKLDELAAAPVMQLSQRSIATQSAGESMAAAQSLLSSSAGAQSEPVSQAQSQPVETPSARAHPEQSTSSDSQTTPGYTIERSAGQVRVSGPGVSIVSSGGSNQAHEGVSHSNAVEPIICEGKRMIHLDGRQIFVDGNAITVRGGCELYVTNSRVIATGTGIVVQDGTVHISNSHIEGQDGSFDANDQAKLFVRASTFQGIPRRSDAAVVQDQGGNRWR